MSSARRSSILGGLAALALLPALAGCTGPSESSTPTSAAPDGTVPAVAEGAFPAEVPLIEGTNAGSEIVDGAWVERVEIESQEAADPVIKEQLSGAGFTGGGATAGGQRVLGYQNASYSVEVTFETADTGAVAIYTVRPL